MQFIITILYWRVPESNYFRTNQTAGSTQKVKVWVTGDCGTSNEFGNQANVKNSFLDYVGASYIDAWLLLGDNAYNNGTDEDYQNNFFNVYQGDRIMKQTNIYPVPGNHDYTSVTQRNHLASFYDIFSNAGAGQMGGVPSQHKEYYSYDIGNIHFVALDSYGIETSNDYRLSDTLSPQVVWLKADLAANTQKWTVVYWHHAPYTMGTHNSDTVYELVQIRENLIPIIERYDVDLVLTGHSHTYERSKLIRGHYGMSNTFDSTVHNLSSSSGKYDGSFDSCPYEKKSDGSMKGTVYMVSGTAGNVLEFRQGKKHNALPYFVDENIGGRRIGGSLLLEVEDNRLDIKMIGANGLVMDKFTMVKYMNQKSFVDIPSNFPVLELKSPYRELSNWPSIPLLAESVMVTHPVNGMQFHVKDTKNCLEDILEIRSLDPCENDIIMDYKPEAPSNINVTSGHSISGTAVLPSLTKTIFNAKGFIELKPGFETKMNSNFTAQIGGCVNSSNN